MDLRQAEYVVAVVDNGTFTAASTACHVSQPALSQAISALERELGTPLFHRIGRQVTLTPAGTAFVEPARRMLRDAEIARQVVVEAANLQTGRLDLVALPTLVAEPLVALVGEFVKSHCSIFVRINEPEGSDEVAEQVRSGQSELGLGDHAPNDPLLESDIIGRQALHAILPPGTSIPSSGRIRVARLAGFPLITTPKGTSTRRLLGDALREADPEEDPSIGVVTEHREAIVPLVMAGAGAAVLPEPLAKAAAKLGAVVAPVSPAIERDVVLVRRKGPLTPAARVFRDLALSYQQDH